MAVRVEESRRKRTPGCNGPDRGFNVTPRESEPTSGGSFMARESDKSPNDAKQMNANQACAASHTKLEWHGLDWRQIESNVKRLQARIAKAVAQGRWNKVKALQRLLSASFHGKAVAVKRVTDNRGKNTPGVDGTLWSTPEHKAQAVTTLCRRGYRAQPLRRVHIPKANGKLRPLGIPTMRDRAIQALHLLALEPVAETTADGDSYGFRPERSTADAIEAIFNVLAKKGAVTWVLEADIKGCFDNISHEWLMAHVPTDRLVLKQWLKAGYCERGQLHDTHAGTPQGGIISPVLANMTLDGLQALVEGSFLKANKQPRFRVIRYADDFIVTGDSKEMLEHTIRPMIENFLAERGLVLSPDKTRITHIDEGFDFLGQNVRKYGGKLLIKPSLKNYTAFIEDIRETISAHKQAKTESLIAALNPKIRGWANYHRHVVSTEVFHKADHEIFCALWKWTQRRHPHKSKGWIRQKYFRRMNGRSWVFAADTLDRRGRLVVMRITFANDVKIKRHVKIRREANPHATEFRDYFAERRQYKAAQRKSMQHRQVDLWFQQQGTCPVCGQPIDLGADFDEHHIQPRQRGGSDDWDNLVLLHPNCHRQVHHAMNNVKLPAFLMDGLAKA